MPGWWLKSLRTFFASIDGCLELNTSFLPSIQRHHDEHIMDIVLQSGIFSNSEMRQINHCIMYLQVIMLSDICLADGALLDKEMLLGELDMRRSSTTSWIQINQARPHETSWKLWL
jgi:hypothetical protein